MMDLSVTKLNKLIDLLEKEVKLRRYFKQEMKKRSKHNVITVLDDGDSSTSEEDEEDEDEIKKGKS